MDHCELREDETLEDLQLEGLKLLQKKKGFRFGMDSVLLAHFAFIQENDTVASNNWEHARGPRLRQSG